MNFWKYTKHFKNDVIKGASNTDPLLCSLMDKIREHFNAPVIIHRVHDSKAHQNSQHSKKECNACDFHINTRMPLLNQWIELQRFNFSALGVYPFWKHPGFHIDLRNKIGDLKAFWLRDREGEYHALNKQTLRMVK